MNETARCRDCVREPATPGRLTCTACGERRRVQGRRRYHALAAAGRCVACGKPRTNGRPVTCAGCMALMRAAKVAQRNRRRAAGQCLMCGRVCDVAGRLECAACLATARARMAAVAAARRSAGRCLGCGREATPGRVTCQACRDRRAGYRAAGAAREAAANGGTQRPALETARQDYMRRTGRIVSLSAFRELWPLWRAEYGDAAGGGEE